jgi:hypothetical protein
VEKATGDLIVHWPRLRRRLAKNWKQKTNEQSQSGTDEKWENERMEGKKYTNGGGNVIIIPTGCLSLSHSSLSVAFICPRFVALFPTLAASGGSSFSTLLFTSLFGSIRLEKWPLFHSIY